jgi:hypothetical protein
MDKQGSVVPEQSKESISSLVGKVLLILLWSLLTVLVLFFAIILGEPSSALLLGVIMLVADIGFIVVVHDDIKRRTKA